MPALPQPEALAPFLATEQKTEMVEKGLHFWIAGISERTGTDPKGNPKPELVYTIFCPELIDGPGAFSLARTEIRRRQADQVIALLPEGTVGPCVLHRSDTDNGQTLYTIEPAEEKTLPLTNGRGRRS